MTTTTAKVTKAKQLVAAGKTVAEACKAANVSTPTYYKFYKKVGTTTAATISTAFQDVTTTNGMIVALAKIGLGSLAAALDNAK